MPTDNETSSSIKQSDYGRVVETQEAYGYPMKVGGQDGCVVVDVGGKRAILPPKTALATAQIILELCGFKMEAVGVSPLTILEP